MSVPKGLHHKVFRSIQVRPCFKVNNVVRTLAMRLDHSQNVQNESKF